MAAVVHADDRLEDRLKYLWDFDAAPNTGGVDLSNSALSAGAKNPGTQTLNKNGTQYLNYTVESGGAQFGTAYNASNTGTFPRISNAGGIGLTYQDGFSVSMWIRPTNSVVWGDYFTIGTSTRSGGATNYLYMQSGGNGKYNVYGNGLIVGGASTASITQNVWNHVALTYQNGVATLYLNGESAGQWTGAPIADANVTQFTLGNGDSGSKTTAMYDEVALFSGALTKEQVAYLAAGRVSDAIKAENNASIPEPSTAVLSLLSLGGLILRRRRAA